MNLDKLTDFAMGVVIVAALTGTLPIFNKWIHLQMAKILYESRTSTWGSPVFFQDHNTRGGGP